MAWSGGVLSQVKGGGSLGECRKPTLIVAPWAYRGVAPAGRIGHHAQPLSTTVREPLMRLALSGVLLTTALLGCGGDDSNEPDDPFPDVEGVYEVSGTFDGIPTNQAFFDGR